MAKAAGRDEIVERPERQLRDGRRQAVRGVAAVRRHGVVAHLAQGVAARSAGGTATNGCPSASPIVQAQEHPGGAVEAPGPGGRRAGARSKTRAAVKVDVLGADEGLEGNAGLEAASRSRRGWRPPR
ncbi:MAG: hypothetical protein U0470_02175 [Anaerolineae bacterium]